MHMLVDHTSSYHAPNDTSLEAYFGLEITICAEINDALY